MLDSCLKVITKSLITASLLDDLPAA